MTEWRTGRVRLPAPGFALACAFATACSGGAAPAERPAPLPPAARPAGPAATVPGELPPVPPRDGPLAIDVVYPPAGSTIAARDSNFIFGSIGSGLAELRINDTPVAVAPNGAFLVFMPVPPDGRYRLETIRGADTLRAEHSIGVPQPLGIPGTGAHIIERSIYPTGALALPYEEPFEIGFQGSAGGRATVRLPSGLEVQLIEDAVSLGPTTDARNFERDAPAARGHVGGLSWYRGSVRAELLRARDSAVAFPIVARAGRFGGAPQDTAVADARAGWQRDAVFELVVGKDTATLPVPLSLAPSRGRVGIATPPADAPPDWTLRGRPSTSGPYHWFFPPGTRLQLTGERNAYLRVRLSPDLSAWVPKAEVTLLQEGAPLPRADIGGVRFVAADHHIDLRVPLGSRLPFAVDGDGSSLVLDIYGGTSETNFFQFGSLDPLIERAMWSQPMDEVYRVAIDLNEPVWGYQTFYDGDVLVLRIRRPPETRAERPFAGLLIAVDAGHPPAGAMGPTRLTEAEANLPVAQKLRELLEAAGARVLMTRNDTSAVDLGFRPRMAADSNAHVLVSIHNNAFPDGVNPFENAGTSVYFHQPHSLDLARHVQRELLATLGTRDIGIGRADLALVRPTWMPAILSETLYMMLPRHEAALRDPSTQERIARAHMRALEAFLRSRRLTN